MKIFKLELLFIFFIMFSCRLTECEKLQDFEKKIVKEKMTSPVEYKYVNLIERYKIFTKKSYDYLKREKKFIDLDIPKEHITYLERIRDTVLKGFEIKPKFDLGIKIFNPRFCDKLPRESVFNLSNIHLILEDLNVVENENDLIYLIALKVLEIENKQVLHLYFSRMHPLFISQLNQIVSKADDGFISCFQEHLEYEYLNMLEDLRANEQLNDACIMTFIRKNKNKYTAVSYINYLVRKQEIFKGRGDFYCVTKNRILRLEDAVRKENLWNSFELKPFISYMLRLELNQSFQNKAMFSKEFHDFKSMLKDRFGK